MRQAARGLASAGAGSGALGGGDTEETREQRRPVRAHSSGVMWMGKRREQAKARGGQGHAGRRPGPAAPDAPGDIRDGAPGLPGSQLNDPEETARAEVHRHAIFPQRRGGGPR